MWKKTILCAVLLGSLLAASIGSAAPLSDYSPGKTAVDINWLPNLSCQNQNQYGTINASGQRGNFDWTATTGLGHDFALQYRLFNPETANYPWGNACLKTQQINVLYQLNPGLSVFAGWHQAKIDSPYTGASKNSLQAGLTGSTLIAPKTHLYGVVGFGKNLFNSEAGVSYEIASNTELNLFYRYTKINNLAPYASDVTVKGVGAGLTFKF